MYNLSMQVNSATLFLIQSFIALVLFAALAAGVWYFFMGGFSFNLSDTATNLERRAEITRLSAAAGTYSSRMHSFDKVCDDIGLPSGYVCNESNSAFAVATILVNGLYYCADSSGFKGEISRNIGKSTKCQ